MLHLFKPTLISIRGWFHPSVAGNLLALEATTDDRGHFALPTWGPRVTFSRYLPATQPTIVAFHRDYDCWVMGNAAATQESGRFGPVTVKSEWSGRTIELKRSSGDPQALEANGRLAEYYLMLDFADECTWERMPRLAAELVRRGKLSRKSGIASILPDEAQLHRGGVCKQLMR